MEHTVKVVFAYVKLYDKHYSVDHLVCVTCITSLETGPLTRVQFKTHARCKKKQKTKTFVPYLHLHLQVEYLLCLNIVSNPSEKIIPVYECSL